MIKSVLSRKEISQRALRHGELQVKRMLKDRPAMAKHIIKNDIIWKWAVKKFAGEDLPDTIDWDNRVPYHGTKSAQLYPCKTERGCINVAKGLSFEVSWAGAIFELFNIAFYSEFQEVIRKAYKGELKKKEFILKMAKTEFKAIKMAEKFYKDIWEPWARQKCFSTDPYVWNVGCPSKFKEWIKCFDKNSDYPWKTYSDFYDNHLEEWALA